MTTRPRYSIVVPAKAGISNSASSIEVPAFAGTTEKGEAWSFPLSRERRGEMGHRGSCFRGNDGGEESRSSAVIPRGFTLLELLIVLGLLALLAGIALTSYLGRVETARLQKVETDFSIIATALSLYKLDAGVLPTSSQGLIALREAPTLAPRPLRYKQGGYLDEVPLDPWGNPYRYLQPARVSEREYDLYSLGADGREGGEAQDADRYH